MRHLSTTKERLHDLGVDALFISFGPHIRWSSGFTGSNGLLIVTIDNAHLVTDGRYRDQAQNEVPDDVTVHISSDGLDAYLAESKLLADCRQVAFQSDHVTVSRRSHWDECFEDTEFVPVERMLTEQVGVKSEDEVEAIAAAQRLTDRVFADLLDLIRPGMTEKEVAAEIVYRHMKGGAEKMSFDPIVASGPNGALPHARPTRRVLREGELVVIDMGCFLDGYASDMTRTVAIGTPDEEMKRVYNAVLEAQKAALQVARAGMQASTLDATARDVLTSHDLGDAFTHSLGHGLGLEIHEWPRVSRKSGAELPEGVVITIEPGVYLPKRFGIRIEDIVVIEKEGCRNLTRAPKDLKQIG